MKALTQIRSLAIGKANTLQRAARHLEELKPAFAEWSEGEIYVCKKTGTYRYRFGDRSKSVTAWDAIARETFATPAAFAFAAMVLAEPPAPVPQADLRLVPRKLAPVDRRANVVALASQAA
jgi:hypothetical protein